MVLIGKFFQHFSQSTQLYIKVVNFRAFYKLRFCQIPLTNLCKHEKRKAVTQVVQKKLMNREINFYSVLPTFSGRPNFAAQ